MGRVTARVRAQDQRDNYSKKKKKVNWLTTLEGDRDGWSEGNMQGTRGGGRGKGGQGAKGGGIKE